MWKGEKWNKWPHLIQQTTKQECLNISINGFFSLALLFSKRSLFHPIPFEMWITTTKENRTRQAQKNRDVPGRDKKIEAEKGRRNERWNEMRERKRVKW